MSNDERGSRPSPGSRTLRDRICAAFEALEDDYDGPLGDRPPGRFERKPWQRPRTDGERGRRRRHVAHARPGLREGRRQCLDRPWQLLARSSARQIPGRRGSGGFWASGICLVAHMHSPKVPAVHMNTRHIVDQQGLVRRRRGSDADDARRGRYRDFHAALKAACDRHDPAYYPRFKAWCDEYFFLKHRNEPRGVGGIFFDNLDSGDWEADFAFTRDVGSAFLDVYPRIVRRHMNESWTEAERRHQLIRRGRYVEFNLLYDRGTLFGLKTGGNPEAILMSLPPEVMWP